MWIRTVAINLTVLFVISVGEPTEPGCGIINEKVAVFDTRAKVPWTASVFYKSTRCDFRLGHFSNGIILGPTTILISGNFLWASSTRLFGFEPELFMVAVGLKAKYRVEADQFTQFIRVSYIQPYVLSHEKYTNLDFALVHLKTPIEFSNRVQPICLPQDDDIWKNSGDTIIGNNTLHIHGFKTAGVKLFQSVPIKMEDEMSCLLQLNSDYQAIRSVSAHLKEAKTPCATRIQRTEKLDENDDMARGFRKKQVTTNSCFQNGAAVANQKSDGKWYLRGTVAEGLGSNCQDNFYFLQLFSKTSIDLLKWIKQSVRNSPNSFTCFNGQRVNYNRDVCNKFFDCEDASDEDKNYCNAIKCSQFSLYCSSKCTADEESFKIGRDTFNYTQYNPAHSNYCPPLKKPPNSTVYCEEPGLPIRLSCAEPSIPETRAVIHCDDYDFNNPVPQTYCVITCQQNGEWTDEIKNLRCQQSAEKISTTTDKPTIAEITTTEKRTNNTPYNQQGSGSINYPTVLTTTTTTESSSTFEISEKHHESDLEEDFLSLFPVVTPSTEKKESEEKIMCSGFDAKEGVKIQCQDPFGNAINCSQPVIPGSKANFACKTYYKSVLPSATVMKTCGPDGRWSLQNRQFLCRLDCGIPKSNIVGHVVNGKITDGLKWPWHAIIFISGRDTTKEQKFTYICGATMISKRILLTAAHCVTNRRGEPFEAERFRLVLGAASNILSDNEMDPNAQVFKAQTIRVHPSFNQQTYESDIALIQLEKPARIDDFVRPSCYPTTSNLHSELIHLSAGSRGEIIGFGYDESGKPSGVLREAELPVVTYSQCYEVTKIQPSSTMFCAGYTNGTAACNGDSGGGMFFQDEVYPRRFYTQGIVSHGNRDKSSRLCDENQYSIFTRVASFKSWIFDNGFELDEDF